MVGRTDKIVMPLKLDQIGLESLEERSELIMIPLFKFGHGIDWRGGHTWVLKAHPIS